MLVVPPSLGVKSLPERIALARRQPGQLKHGSAGVVSASHLAGALFADRAGIDIVHIPFKGGAPAVTELLPGFSATNWYAFIAPGKTPAPILERWNQALVKALESPEVADEHTRAGLLPAPGTRDELARYIASESRTWGQVIRQRRITVE